jgi:hypothetical protein
MGRQEEKVKGTQLLYQGSIMTRRKVMPTSMKMSTKF